MIEEDDREYHKNYILLFRGIAILIVGIAILIVGGCMFYKFGGFYQPSWWFDSLLPSVLSILAIVGLTCFVGWFYHFIKLDRV